MDTPKMRYTVEDKSGKNVHHMNDQGLALHFLVTFAETDGEAHLIERYPTGDVRGYVLKRNT